MTINRRQKVFLFTYKKLRRDIIKQIYQYTNTSLNEDSTWFVSENSKHENIKMYETYIRNESLIVVMWVNFIKIQKSHQDSRVCCKPQEIFKMVLYLTENQYRLYS